MNTLSAQSSAAPLRLNGITQRRDRWWLEPLVSAAVFIVFVIYATWAAFQGGHFEYHNYHSPFSWPIHPDWWPFSPALLTLWAPLGFRVTCYFIRRVYYRAFFWDPPACAVAELRKGYTGESRFPMILHNLHRFFLYVTLIELCVLWFDAARGFIFPDGIGAGTGSIVLVVNASLLSLYTFSCHAFRHLVGGNVDCFSKCPRRYSLWKKVTLINEHHGLWMWISLFWVGFSDLYVRLLSMGMIRDLRFF